MTTTNQQIFQFPPGWKLVPITPTKRMIKAADSACRNACNEYADYYNAMIFIKQDALQPLTIIMREILIQNKVDYTMIKDARQASEMAGLTQLLKYSTIVIASIPVLILYPFVQKYFVEGVMVGSVKG